MTRLSDGRVCFVPDAVTGERIEVEVLRETKRFVEGKLLRIVEASPDRVRPPCPYFGVCGGCSYQHISYDRQVSLKTSQVREALRRIGGIESPDVRPTIPSPLPYGYRNRITVHRRGGRIGFHRRDGGGLVDIEQCLIASDVVNGHLEALRKEPFRDGPRTLRGRDDRAGFHQTNDAVADLLLEYIAETCDDGGPALVDAYCGDGFFARRLASRFERALGIEWNERSVARARELAGPNESYLDGDVADHLGSVLTELKDVTLLLDPPSQGVDARVIDAVSIGNVRKLLYVSCNPGTLARDLKMLGGKFRFAQAQPFDMFPQTAEIEVVAVLESNA